MSATYPAVVQEAAFVALENVNREIDRFLAAIRDDLGEALLVGAWKPDVAGELAFLRETITEHLRSQLPEAVEAAAEWSHDDPLAGPRPSFLTVARDVLRVAS